jgi:uncharacterized protein
MAQHDSRYMFKRIIRVLGIFTVILFLAGFYVGSKFIMWSDWAAAHQIQVWLDLSCLIFLALLGPVISRMIPNWLNSRLYVFHWLTNMALGVTFTLIAYTAVVDLVGVVLKLFMGPEGRMQFQHLEPQLVLWLSGLSVLGGIVQAWMGPKIYNVEIVLDNLAPEFDGFKIAQISDLHIGSMIGARFVENVVDKTNNLAADIVVLTGDIIDGAVDYVTPIVSGLAKLKASDGIYYATGNHEYYWQVAHAIANMKRIGAQILINENVELKRGENSLVIAGVTDVSAGAMEPGHLSDPEKAAKGAPLGAVKILLAHQPGDFRRTAAAGFDVQLSGHTHGGQFFPWNIVVNLAQKYSLGLYRFDKMWIYVNRGTASWGPRLRFLVPSEITCLTLRSKSSAGF